MSSVFETIKLKAENIFKRTDNTFGLKDKDVKITLKELEEERISVKKRIDDLSEKNKGPFIDRLLEIREQIKILSVSPKQVLKDIASFSKAYKDIDKVGSPTLFFNLLIEQNPSISRYYPLLRKTPSGLDFGQQVLSAQARQQAVMKNGR